MSRKPWLLAGLALLLVALVVVGVGRWLSAGPAPVPGDGAGAEMPARPSAQPLPAAAAAPPPAADDVPLTPLPVSTVDAGESMRQALEKGDPSAPPLVRDPPRELPTAAELADPRAYQEYEARQSQRLYNQYVRAANSEIPRLQADIARARAAGLPPEQIAEGEEKLRRIQAMRDQLQAEKGATAAP